MADARIGNTLGVAAANVDNGGATRSNLNGSGSAQALEFNTSDYQTIFAMKIVLATADAGYYTAARMNKMTYNDMVYAVRVLNDPETITPRT